jgi:O-6-methylguanine DNA methyltransferase
VTRTARPAREADKDTYPGSFTARVLSVVRRIPPGRVATYGDVAKAAGRPLAHRAVGNIMRTCGPTGVPAHRVIAAAGRLGGYGGNLELKRNLLRAEGVHVVGLRIRDFNERRWTTSAKAPASPAKAKGKRAPTGPRGRTDRGRST